MALSVHICCLKAAGMQECCGWASGPLIVQGRAVPPLPPPPSPPAAAASAAAVCIALFRSGPLFHPSEAWCSKPQAEAQAQVRAREGFRAEGPTTQFCTMITARCRSLQAASE